MNELIPIVDYNDRKMVNARTLHTTMEVRRDFSTWIKNRIEKYGFVKNEDYEIIVPKFGDYSNRVGNPNFVNIDYLLTINTAKEIAIVENNEKGRQIRRYLIKLEEAWNTPEMLIERLRQMGYLPQAETWKSPPASRIREMRMSVKENMMSVSEYRRLAFNLDTPENLLNDGFIPAGNVKSCTIASGKGNFVTPKPEKIDDTVVEFAKNYLDITGHISDFMTVQEIFDLFRKEIDSPLSRNKFVRQLRKVSPHLEYKQKKINGDPILVFLGMKPKE